MTYDNANQPIEEGEIVEFAPVPQQSATIVRAAPGDVAAAFSEYQQIQATLDKAMPDCIMQIGDRKFRKKNYWRGVAVAFNVTLSLVSERKTEGEDEGDWGWLVTYRAAAPNGRAVDGDGACFASEKWSDRMACPSCGKAEAAYASKQKQGEFFCWAKKGGCGHEWTPEKGAETAIDKSQASVHNVRSHAHTRAKNRAVADLCGFGEVSAEEMPHNTPQPQKSPPERSSGSSTISEAQGNRLWAIAADRAKRFEGVTDEDIVKSVYDTLGVEGTMSILRGYYDTVVTAIEKWAPKDPAADGEGF